MEFKKLTDEEREVLFQDNMKEYYSIRKKYLSEQEYTTLINNVTEDMIRKNLNADCSGDILDLDVSDIVGQKLEHLKLYCLGEDKRVINEQVIAIGDEETVGFDYYKIAATLIEHNARYFTFVHNHPTSYGARFSNSDLNMAFNVARLGECLGVYIDDFVVVTKYDVAKLSSNQDLFTEICDFRESDSQFCQQSLMISSEPLFKFLNSIKNKRRREMCSFNNNYLPTSKEDLSQCTELIQRLLAHCDDRKLKNEILDEMQRIINEWRL